MPNPNNVGDVSEAIILSRLLNHNFKVFLPFNKAKCDFIAQSPNGELYKIECKTGRYDEDLGVVRAFLTQTPSGVRREYSENEVDKFAIYCPDLDECYLVDFEDSPRTEISLRVDPTQNNQVKRVRYAKDYKF